MRDLLIQVLAILIPLFAVTSMLSVGLAHSLKEIAAPLRNVRLIAGAIVANFIFVPLLAIFLSSALALEEPFKIGLFLLAAAGGAPFLVKLTIAARGDLATSTAVLSMLLVITIFYMPIVIPLALPGTAVSSASIAVSLVLTMLLPLCIGIAVREWRLAFAIRLQPIANHVSTISLVGLILLIIVVHFWATLAIFGSSAIWAALLLTAGAFVAGYYVAGADFKNRSVLGLATSQRNVAAATVVASQDIDRPDVLVMVIVTSLIALFVLFPVAWAFRRKQTEASDGRYRIPKANGHQPIGEMK